MKYTHKCRICNSSQLKFNDALLAPFITHRMFSMTPTKTRNLYGNFDNDKFNYLPCYSCLCLNCDFLGVNIIFDDEEMANLYRGYRSEEYDRVRKLYEPTYSSDIFSNRHEYISEVESLLSSVCKHISTVIDFGGGDGINTPILKGADTYVMDISDMECKYKKTDKLFKCDLITCMQVLEHVPDPNDICQTLKNNSKYYYFEVPNEDVTILKELWHEHINFFNMKSFTTFLSNYFEILHTETSDIHIRVICKDL